MKTKIIFYMGLFTWLFGCKPADNKPGSLPEITSRSDAEEGWHDTHFKIVSSTSMDSTKTFICKGLHKGKTVGLEVEVRSDMGAGITPGGELNSQVGFIQNAVQLRSIGQESDELIRALSELYGFPTDKPFTKRTKWLTAFSLNQKPIDLSKSDYYRIKIFFDYNEELYAELFLNFNISANEIELNEKDEGYRENVVKLLTE